jgi:hypothetical protein
MNAQFNNAIILKLPNDRKAEDPPLPEDLTDKARLFWQKTLEAGRREEQIPRLHQLKLIAWDANLGAVKGFFKGTGQALKNLIDPRSDFYNPDYREIFKDIQQLPDAALDHGIAYMEEDWKGRGEMNAEKSVAGGIWLLKIYFGAKGLASGIFMGAKKLIR